MTDLSGIRCLGGTKKPVSRAVWLRVTWITLRAGLGPSEKKNDCWLAKASSLFFNPIPARTRIQGLGQNLAKLISADWKLASGQSCTLKASIASKEISPLMNLHV